MKRKLRLKFRFVKYLYPLDKEVGGSFYVSKSSRPSKYAMCGKKHYKD